LTRLSFPKNRCWKMSDSRIRPTAKNYSKDKVKGRLKTGRAIFAENSAVIPAQAGIQTFRHGNLSNKRFL
ncbi:TPA: hypothetical protein ACFNM3_002200, partial [Neisseria lactamica]